MTGPPYRPIDARIYPRFAGVRTFMRLPHVTDLTGVDAAVYGIPFDTAVTFRPGARFGPEAIRSASALLRPFHSGFGIDLCETLSIVDYGDLPVAPGDTEGTYRRVEEALAPVVEAGAFPLALGGDHSITLAELRVIAKRHGPLALVQLDAHGDTWDEYFDQRYFHGTTFRRAAEEGLIDPTASVQAGMRGPLFQSSDLDDGRALGFQVIPSEELRALGPDAYGELVRERVADRPVFLSFDVDFLDPASCARHGHAGGRGLLDRGGDRLPPLAEGDRARGRRRGRGVAALRRAGPDHGAGCRQRRLGAPRPAGGRMIARPNQEDRMRTILLVDHRVADFDAWLKVYDEVRQWQHDSGVRFEQVLRSTDDPNRVLVTHAFESREGAESFVNNAELREAMGRGGVDGSSVKIEYFDEVESEDV